MAGHGKRKVHHEPPEKDESEVRWLISYSDFMMQLVCLFILLYSVSAIDTTKAKALSEAYRESKGLEPVRVKDLPSRAIEPPLSQVRLDRVIQQIEVTLGRLPEGKDLRVLRTADGFQLKLIHPMFDEGSSELSVTGQKLTDMVYDLLAPMGSLVEKFEIAGHTAVGISDTVQGSSMELSLARSRRVVQRLNRLDERRWLNAKSVKASGRGAYDPVADNANPETRARNRRVDFLVTIKDPRAKD